MNKFLKEFKDRGFFYQCTNEEDLSKLLDKKKIKAYIGFDCTAESLHVGSLLQIMCLRLHQSHGHQPIVLLGDGTTRIGDPSGSNTMVGGIDERGLLPGSISLAVPPKSPNPLGAPGFEEKSSISLFNKNPPPETEIPLPYEKFKVVVLLTTFPEESHTEK